MPVSINVRIPITDAERQSIIDEVEAGLPPAGELSGFTSGLVSIPAGGTANVNTGLTTINDISVYQAGEDISDSISATISAPIIVLSSNRALTNLTVKANGS